LNFDCIIFLLKASPSPVPNVLVVKYGLKILFRFSFKIALYGNSKCH